MTTNSNELVFQAEAATTTKNLFRSRAGNGSLQQNKNIKKLTSQWKQKNQFVSKFQRSQFQAHSSLSLRANIFLVSLVFLLYFTFNQHSTSVEACLCHLIPNFQCGDPPPCCESGQYAKDECGCCLTCAKSELQPCGGPSGAHGKCSSGLQCLKTCSKYTLVFPYCINHNKRSLLS